MIDYKSMVARFTDSDILKIVADPDMPYHVYVTTLDSDGEEVVSEIYLTYPILTVKLINNSNLPITLTDTAQVTAYGIYMKNVEVLPGQTKIIDTICATPDGTTYIGIISGTNINTFTVTDLVNCVDYSPNIVMTDMDITKERSCTITVTA